MSRRTGLRKISDVRIDFLVPTLPQSHRSCRNYMTRCPLRLEIELSGDAFDLDPHTSHDDTKDEEEHLMPSISQPLQFRGPWALRYPVNRGQGDQDRIVDIPKDWLVIDDGIYVSVKFLRVDKDATF